MSGLVTADVQQSGEALPVMAAVKRCPEVCPVHLITAELALAASQQNGCAFERVPEHLITAELAMAAVSQTSHWYGFYSKRRRCTRRRIRSCSRKFGRSVSIAQSSFFAFTIHFI